MRIRRRVRHWELRDCPGILDSCVFAMLSFPRDLDVRVPAAAAGEP
jgi:hypothetical protein